MNAKIRYGLSAAVLALIAVGAPAPDILDQFLDEKEGNHTTAYRDGAGIWTICRGATMVDGKPVIPGMKLSKEKCDQVNAIERDKALAWVERNIKVPLTEPQKAGIASFCPYNIGPGKCFPSDAPRDKCTLSCAINGIHAAFHYLKKNYISGCVMTVPTG